MRAARRQLTNRPYAASVGPPALAFLDGFSLFAKTSEGSRNSPRRQPLTADALQGEPCAALDRYSGSRSRVARHNAKGAQHVSAFRDRVPICLTSLIRDILGPRTFQATPPDGKTMSYTPLQSWPSSATEPPRCPWLCRNASVPAEVRVLDRSRTRRRYGRICTMVPEHIMQGDSEV